MSLLMFSGPEEVESHCRETIQRHGSRGGFILTNGAVTEVIFDLAAISDWPVTLPASLTVAALDSVNFAVAMPVPPAVAHGAANLATITATNHDYPAITLTATITGTANRTADSLTVTPTSQTVLPSSSVGCPMDRIRLRSPLIVRSSSSRS